MKYALIFIFGITLNFMSCTKDNSIQEVENESCLNPVLPGEYFPAYPNSWWKYSNEENETIVYETANKYQLCDNECRPRFLNLDKCIHENAIVHEFYSGLGASSTILSPIYTPFLDSIAVCPVSFSTFETQDAFLHQEDVRFRRQTTVLDTNLYVDGTIYNDVLVVYETNKFDSTHRYYDYFSKNIGLIRRDSVDQSDTTNLIELLKLEDYHLGL
ncbi:hypothetical protein [Brumimicrobium aurantiacum]|uniref:Uncharacterized protein n=1 Tax=Brumimicrobium aurantiacum TaxID=1737063 RepID=A0A3E1F138_9FLAO|nr:hypothetical protein [Brumimicrobium aurantiacum]RFC55542.1 hypothetical protein DXU93_01010 [Brumimicrobium aurantiacum]